MELGSEFEVDISSLKKIEDSIFEYLKDFNCVYLDSGRSATRFINHNLKLRKILLPSYICESVISIYKSEFQVEFYQVTKDFQIDLADLNNKINQSVDAIYLMHYFGQVQNSNVLRLLDDKRKKYGFIIIEDTTHSIFTNKHTIGDYCVCSLRKWFPIPDGGVAYSKNILKKQTLKSELIPIKFEAMIMKNLYLHKKLSCKSLYRQIFHQAEQKLDEQTEIHSISKISEILLLSYSINDLKEHRKKNLSYVKSQISKIPLIPVFKETSQDFTPLTFPIFVDNRDSFKKFLIDNKIYCAVHWPLEDIRLKRNPTSLEISNKIISIPIDQRYGKEDMDYLVNLIKKYYAQEGAK